MSVPSRFVPFPTFRVLDRPECDAILSRNAVGRLAYTLRGRVDLEPIHYAHDEDWLYGRTSEGSKLDVLAHHPWVAFEVDEIRGTFDWASVVVHGTFYRMHPEGSYDERQTYARSLAALRRILPGTLSADDPVPTRRVVFGVHVDDVTGRAASP